MDNVTQGSYNTYLHKNTTVTKLIAPPLFCRADLSHVHTNLDRYGQDMAGTRACEAVGWKNKIIFIPSQVECLFLCIFYLLAENPGIIYNSQ